MKDTIAVIDLGGQYCHLIKRSLRDIGVQATIYTDAPSLGVLAEHAGIILSGGPRSVYEEGAPRVDPAIIELGLPILGICYGHQLLAQMLGAKIERGQGEYGHNTITLRTENTIFKGTPPTQSVWMSHGDSITELPDGLKVLASTEGCETAAIGDEARRFYGVQFHPEVIHSDYGEQILKNFSRLVCGLEQEARLEDQVPLVLDDIRARAGEKSVFFLVSGGVDSTVAFSLCAQALSKERVVGLYVDTGLMRKGETGELRANLEALGFIDRFHVREESERFIRALDGVIDPEKKRHIIGRLFVEVQAEAMRDYGIDEEHWLLGQGTIYPDTIESGGSSGRAAVIKTHHNRCAEIMELIEKGRVIEPLTEFYKDEVRKLGRAIGLDAELTNRWPFPGPGLAIRCLCSAEEEAAERLSEHLDGVVRERGFDGILLPIRSVGVQGDVRTYRNVAAIRGPLDCEALQSLGTTLCNLESAPNRVIYLVAGDEDRLADARVKKAEIHEERLALLREADFIARSMMAERGLTDSVWQFPVVLIPIALGEGESVVLRPVNSRDGMTANFARLPRPVLKQMADRIRDLRGVDAVFLDVTDKPPATIEWE